MTAVLAMTDPFVTSKSTSVEAVELPRYRKRRSQNREVDTAINPSPLLPRYNSNDAAESSTRTPSIASTPSLANRPVVRTLNFRRPIINSDITIHTVNAHTGTETPVYHAHTYEWKLSQPDIVLYSGGQSDPAHVIAASRFRWTRNARMGFGSNCLDDTATDTQWEDMKNTSSWRAHYQYDFAVPSQSSSEPGGGRRRLRWLRTHKEVEGVEGWAGYLSFRNYKLIDVETEEVIGVFLADNLRSLTKKGELRLFEPLAKEVEVAVVLSMSSISQKATRRGRIQKNPNPE